MRQQAACSSCGYIIHDRLTENCSECGEQLSPAELRKSVVRLAFLEGNRVYARVGLLIITLTILPASFLFNFLFSTGLPFLGLELGAAILALSYAPNLMRPAAHKLGHRCTLALWNSTVWLIHLIWVEALLWGWLFDRGGPDIVELMILGGAGLATDFAQGVVWIVIWYKRSRKLQLNEVRMYEVLGFLSTAYLSLSWFILFATWCVAAIILCILASGYDNSTGW